MSRKQTNVSMTMESKLSFAWHLILYIFAPGLIVLASILGVSFGKPGLVMFAWGLSVMFVIGAITVLIILIIHWLDLREERKKMVEANLRKFEADILREENISRRLDQRETKLLPKPEEEEVMFAEAKMIHTPRGGGKRT